MNSRPATPGGALVGRQSELIAIGRFLKALLGEDGVAAGPGALLIQGPAGIGKTTLWLAALEQAAASSVRVLKARPAEAEATFAYTAGTRRPSSPVSSSSASRLAGERAMPLIAIVLAPDGATAHYEHGQPAVARGPAPARAA